MIHKNTIIICLLLSILNYLSINAQSFNTVKRTSIFEYGVAIQSVEDNFKNLFQNFPDLIGNKHQIKLLSYEYVGLTGSQRNVRRIVGRNFYRGALVWFTSISRASSTSSFIDEEGVSHKNFCHTEISFRLNIQNLDKSRSELRRLRDFIVDQIQPDFKVYKLRWQYQHGRERDFFIFVNPETNRVVQSGNLFYFSW